MQVLSVVAPVKTQAVGDVIDLVGEVEALNSVDLVSETDARLEAMGFEEGGVVTRGQLLFRFDDVRLQALLAQTTASHTLAEANLKRGRELLKSATIPQQEFDQVETAFRSAEAALALARKNCDDARVEAPFDGTITRRHVSVGQFVGRGQALASLVQLSPLEVVFHAPERHLSNLAAGNHVAFQGATETAQDAEIVYLSPRLDPATRTLEIKARLANPDGRLRPGMFGRVRLTANANPQACVVPAAALTLSATGNRVVVMNAEGRAEFRDVTPGRRADDWVEILTGLEPGERVVVEGHQKLGPGVRILISPKSTAYGIEPEAPPAAPAAAAPANPPAG